MSTLTGGNWKDVMPDQREERTWEKPAAEKGKLKNGKYGNVVPRREHNRKSFGREQRQPEA